jgi:hypothetical protein
MIHPAEDQAFVFFLISGCLGACFIWAFWEIEEARRRRHRQRELVDAARRSVTHGH